MGIADITLLSGFEVVTQDLDMVSGRHLLIILKERSGETSTAYLGITGRYQALEL